ncbi:hypothetical protein K461DRAFT_294135 [Myriangium duriaei CBS 260.36]|uniref:MIT domain-containing protein n=1 Tax=Myriangium duriaei CBS 260.36 TaxID=1168546 RepID=A0A9P4MJV4_9PEZI|nr:hypothetical protein K461DRAFT_294135 [Myriangium duriaei CBS 260.36]
MSNNSPSTHTSLASSSVITVQRGAGQVADSIHIRSASPAEGALLAARALKASAGHKLPSNDPADDNLNTNERWSHSTGSSAPDRRGRSSAARSATEERSWQKSAISPSASPGVGYRVSPHGSPSRFRKPNGDRLGDYLPGKVDIARRRNASGNSTRSATPTLGLGKLPDLKVPMSDSSRAYARSPLSPPIMQPLTPGTAGLTTPSGAAEGNDYFGLGIAVTKDNTPKPGDPTPLSPNHPHYTNRRANFAPQESPNQDKKVMRVTKEKRERDKKTMLSKALEKANTAVLLDNAQNFAAALDAYSDACGLLEQVMERTTGPEDRAKLDAIRNTYATRMEELTVMQNPDAEDGAEKQLPPRPDSNGSDDIVPQLDFLSPVSPLVGPSSVNANNADVSNNSLPPSATHVAHAGGRTRDSFLTDAIREVEGSRTGGFLGPLWERSKSPMSALDENGRSKDALYSVDAPAPLRTPSPQPPQKPNAGATDESGEPGSWLNTIDESDSDSASVHSGKRSSALRRRDLSNGAHKPPTDFDTAFDEAVEAAYEEGYEPDQGDEEQQMMDDIAKDYMDEDFNFNIKSMSSLPRQSDSTAQSRNTLQSSIAGTNRDTTATTLTTLDEDTGVFPRARHQAQSSTSTAQTTGDESGPTSAHLDASAGAIDKRRRLSNASMAPSIEGNISITARRRRAPSTASKRTDMSHRDLDVTPWEAADRAEVTPWETHALTQSEVTPWETQAPSGATPSIMSGATPSIMSGPLKDRRNRLSNGSMRPLTIETASIMSGRRKRATSTSSKKTEHSQRDLEVTPWETAEQRAEVTPWETHAITTAEVTPWEMAPGPSDAKISKLTGARRNDRDPLTSVPSSALSDSGSSMVGDISSPKSRYLRNQKSSLSLRETVSEVEPPLPTPTSTSFSTAYTKRNDSTSHLSQKSLTIVSNGTMPPPLPADGGQQGGFYLFDTTLGRSVDTQPMSSSPRTTKESAPPAPFEPCPDSAILRPFWLLRAISNTATHPRGAYITTRLFMPHEAWLNRSAKLKNLEDKIAACDTLTAALAPLDRVDTLDADAVLEELQKFEEIMERVQTMLMKKLGHEVGVANSMFKEADKASADSPPDGGLKGDKNAKFSWRKLRGKGSVSGVPGMAGNLKGGSGDGISMVTVPMTSFSGVEKKTVQRREALRDAVFEGPHRDYMAAVARLCEAAQVIDQIARQIEDPGLKHSSTTHVGLELSTRHAAEFFGFYICRFLLADIGMLIDKHVKRSTEWVLT